MPKVASVAEAQRRQAGTAAKKGPTVRVRATRRGFYGYPLSSVREPGDEFNMFVSDLKPFVAPEQGKPGKKNWLSQPIESIKSGGALYELPSWCEDARNAKKTDEDESDEFLMGDAEM